MVGLILRPYFTNSESDSDADRIAASVN